MDGPAAGREGFLVVTRAAVVLAEVIRAEVIRAAVMAADTAAVAATDITERPSSLNKWSPPSVGGLFCKRYPRAYDWPNAPSQERAR